MLRGSPHPAGRGLGSVAGIPPLPEPLLACLRWRWHQELHRISWRFRKANTASRFENLCFLCLGCPFRDHLCFQFCVLHTTGCALLAVWSPAPPALPPTQSRSLQRVSRGEFHASDRNSIYLKIDGKSFQAQAIFAKTALTGSREGEWKNSDARDAQPQFGEKASTGTLGRPLPRPGAVLSAPPQNLLSPAQSSFALSPGLLLLSATSPATLRCHIRGQLRVSPPAPQYSCVFPSCGGAHHAGL